MPEIPPPAILMPLPDRDFDPTESAIPWQACVSHGWKVAFSTPGGKEAAADPNLLRGPILGPFGASYKAIATYRKMVQDAAFQAPIPYAEIDPTSFEAIILPGGHAAGMRVYWESPILQAKVLQFFHLDKLVGAICHGVMVLARTFDPQTGHSVLYGRKVTGVPPALDRLGYRLNVTLLRRSYSTYPCTVEKEMLPCLEHSEDLTQGRSLQVPYVVCDGNLVTARYFLDAELFAQSFVAALEQRLSKFAFPSI